MIHAVKVTIIIYQTETTKTTTNTETTHQYGNCIRVTVSKTYIQVNNEKNKKKTLMMIEIV